MKLNKFNKSLKKEFDETIKEEKAIKEKRFNFKIRYAFIGLAFALAAFLIINHIYVINYNNTLDKKTDTYYSAKITEEKYKNKTDLSNALMYTNPATKKESVIQMIGSMFIFKGCESRVAAGSDGFIDETSTAPTDQGNSSYETNVQESGIDEADCAKCDGKYIYSIYANDLSIFDLEGNLRIKETFSRINNLYIYNNKIILLGRDSIKILEFNDTNNTLSIKKEINGSNMESRLVNNYFYYIIQESFSLDVINYDNAYYDGSIDPTCLYKIFKLNLNDLSETEGDLVSSYSSIIYMSNNYFYFVSKNSYLNCATKTTNVFILDYNLDGYAAIKEDGIYLNKYSFSEYEGKLRYVLSDSTYEIRNSIYVYDLAKKELIGSLKNQIGLRYEDVKSVRFDKNLCYVCTYRNTDPLYKIDLSNPQDIKILSELHVDGYSGYLHNFKINNNNYVLGVGISEYNTIKLSLYDSTSNLNQIGKDVVLAPNKLISFDDDIVISVEGDYYDINYIVLSSYIGYFFYTKDDIFYFGTPITEEKYFIFKIDVNNDTSPISLYKEYKYKNTSNSLRCFLVNSKLYYVGDGFIHIEDF